MLAERNNLVVFNPAVYEVTSTMDKYMEHPQISHVYGFVCNQAAADEANTMYGKDGHHFYAGNMEDIDFCNKMDILLEENNLNGFDLVDLTLILKDSEKPFERLSSIVERINQNMFANLIKLLKIDKYAGNRNMGRSVYTYLKRTGATKVRMVNTLLTTANMNAQKRKMLFDTYFSYLEPEIDDLIAQTSDNELYQNAKKWLTENYSQIQQTVMSNEFLFVSGFMFFYGIYEDI